MLYRDMDKYSFEVSVNKYITSESGFNFPTMLFVFGLENFPKVEIPQLYKVT